MVDGQFKLVNGFIDYVSDKNIIQKNIDISEKNIFLFYVTSTLIIL